MSSFTKDARRAGRWVRQGTGDASYAAFIPAPLPPIPFVSYMSDLSKEIVVRKRLPENSGVRKTGLGEAHPATPSSYHHHLIGDKLRDYAVCQSFFSY